MKTQMNKGNTKMKTKLVLSMLVAAVSLSGCNFKSSDAVSSVQNIQSAPLDPNAIPATAVISTRNFTQLNESMAAVTGVLASTNEIAGFFNASKTRFSLDGMTGSTSSSSVLATTSLAGFYCKNLVAKEAAIADMSQRIFFAGINFGQTNTQLSSSVREAVFQKYAERFWRRSANGQETAILGTLIDEAMDGQTASTQQLRNALILSCTAALNSVEFTKS